MNPLTSAQSGNDAIGSLIQHVDSVQARLRDLRQDLSSRIDRIVGASGPDKTPAPAAIRAAPFSLADHLRELGEELDELSRTISRLNPPTI